MALQLGALRSALLEAGASPEKADQAAEELAGYDSQISGLRLQMERLEGELKLVKWMVAVLYAPVIAILVKLFVP